MNVLIHSQDKLDNNHIGEAIPFSCGLELSNVYVFHPSTGRCAVLHEVNWIDPCQLIHLPGSETIILSRTLLQR
jgi:hypothetical protein